MISLIRMSGICKAFGGSVALRDVSIELMPGSVHALMGENGAGKSTLMKILAGVCQPDNGAIYMRGSELTLLNPRDALDCGISTVFQELSLLPNLSIAENMFLGREPTTRFGAIDYIALERETQRALGALGLELDPRTLVSELGIAERQFLEIARGIEADASVFILDEPTAALNATDVEMLNKHIRRLREAGKAIVYISHRLEEIFDICDSVTVLKDGQKVGARPLARMTPATLIEMMVGRELDQLFPARGRSFGAPVLQMREFRITEDAQPFQLSIRQGEIVALAGLEGQGQQKILRSLIGAFRPYSGQVDIRGAPVAMPASPRSGVRRLKSMGAGFIPEDRKGEGLFADLSIAHNITIGLHSARSDLSIARSYRNKIAATMQSMNVKAVGANTAVKSLSGGNQQKVLLGRYLTADADILLIEEPTRGVDIGAKHEIYRLLRDFASNGGAVVVLSRETVELIGLSDRLYVVHDNTIVDDMPASQATEHKILDVALNNSSRKKADRTINPDTNRLNAGQKSRQGLWLLPLIIAVAMCLWLSIRTPRFASPENLFNLTAQVMPLLTAAIGQMFVILIGGLDLSVGSVISFTTAILALEGPAIILIPAVFMLAAGIGLANGVVITRFNVHPIIATLSMQYVVLGITRILRPVSGGSVPEIVTNSVAGSLFGIPLPVFWGIAIILIGWRILYQTRFGLHLFAIGGGIASGAEEAAHNFGISDRRNIVLAYVACSCFAALAGVFLAGRIASGDPNVGLFFELDTITAVAIGGTQLAGGIGSLHGTIIGALIMALLANGMNLANISPFIQTVIKGGILFIVVGLQSRKKIGL